MNITNEFIAGFVDADGCLELSKQVHKSVKTGKTSKYFYPKVIISNNNLEVLELIQDKFGAGRIYSDNKRCYRLVFHNKDCEHFLDDVGELLFVKRREYLLLMRYFESQRDEKKADRAELYHIELRNMKGGYTAV